jgi:exopolysaccharide production protein ExoQ
MGYAIDRANGSARAPAQAGFAHETAGFVAAYVVFQATFLVSLLATAALYAALAAGVIYAALIRRSIAPAVLPVLAFMALPLWALLSTVWSQAPEESLRYGTRLCLTALLALILVRTISARTLAAAIVLAGFVTMVVWLALAQGGLAIDEPMTGAMGTKNYLAGHAGAAAVAAVCVAFDARHSWGMRWIALATLAVSATVLVFAQSVGAWIATIVGVFLIGAFVLSARMPAMARGAALVLLLVSAPLAWFAVPQLGDELAKAGLEATGKDPTLTGRTVLWMRAAPIIAQNPVLGHGYKAFWVRGATDAEGLWRESNITRRGGFNFHNQYIDLLVELGIVGTALFALTALVGAVRLLARAITAGSMGVSFFAAAYFSILLRTPVESLAVNDFALGTIMLFAGCCIGVTPQPEEAREAD